MCDYIQINYTLMTVKYLLYIKKKKSYSCLSYCFGQPLCAFYLFGRLYDFDSCCRIPWGILISVTLSSRFAVEPLLCARFLRDHRTSIITRPISRSHATFARDRINIQPADWFSRLIRWRNWTGIGVILFFCLNLHLSASKS